LSGVAGPEAASAICLDRPGRPGGAAAQVLDLEACSKRSGAKKSAGQRRIADVGGSPQWCLPSQASVELGASRGAQGCTNRGFPNLGQRTRATNLLDPVCASHGFGLPTSIGTRRGSGTPISLVSRGSREEVCEVFTLGSRGGRRRPRSLSTIGVAHHGRTQVDDWKAGPS
jgi:hypothetical protein